MQIPLYRQEEKEIAEPFHFKTVIDVRTGHKKIHVQISPKNKVNIYWNDNLPPEFFSTNQDNAPSWIELNHEQNRELRLSMKYLLSAIVTTDGKPPKVICEKRIPPIPPELKARRAKEFVANVIPLIFWWGYVSEDMKNKQNELRILLMAEMEKQKEFSHLRKDLKTTIERNLIGQLFWDYWNETRKTMDNDFQDYEAWLDQKIKNKLNETATMPVEKRFSERRRTLDRMAQLPFE